MPWPDGWQQLKRDAFAATDALSWVRPLGGLRKRPRDPRQTPLLVHLAGLVTLQQPAFRADIGACWKANGDPLARVGMEAVAHRLGVDPKAFWGVTQGQLDAPAQTSPQILALVETLRRPIPLHPVLRAVYDSPHEDGPRRVLSDLLLERGDPWGELIALQLSGDAGERTQDLLAQLTHRLGQALGGVRASDIQRGFPLTVRLGKENALRPSPAWSTVRDVHFEGELETGDHVARGIARFLNDPDLRSLETVANAPLDSIDSSRIRRVRMSGLRPAALASLIEISSRMTQVEHWSLGEVELASAGVLLDLPLPFDAGAVGRWRLRASADVVALELISASARDQWLEILRRRAVDRRALEIRAGRSARIAAVDVPWLRQMFAAVAIV